jgi:AcrR family transcriptional regulator
MSAESLPDLSPTRLPSGRHRLTRADVFASQRGRLLDAVAHAVAEKNFGAATVADVVRRAGVSRKTFYEHFADKESAFLATYDAGVEVLLGRLTEAARDVAGEGWRERVRSDLSAYMDLLASEPAFAWALHVEVLAAGPGALARRAEVFALFAERTRRLHAVARRQEPDLPKLPPEAYLFHSGGIDEMVRECLRTSGAGALPGLAAPALKATLALFGATA